MKLVLLAIIAVSLPGFAQDNPAPTQSAPARTADDPPGGYAPPPMAPPPPGAVVVFKPGPPPDIAFPPPAPLASYPVCRHGQTDHCIQRHDPK